MELTIGSRWQSVTCATQVVIVRSPESDVDLRCGGKPMVAAGGDVPGDGPPTRGFDAGSTIGKRMVHDEAGVEVLCVTSGAGALSIGDELLTAKGTKPLPSSD